MSLPPFNKPVLALYYYQTKKLSHGRIYVIGAGQRSIACGTRKTGKTNGNLCTMDAKNDG
jgi:hypothetical protein